MPALSPATYSTGSVIKVTTHQWGKDINGLQSSVNYQSGHGTGSTYSIITNSTSNVIIEKTGSILVLNGYCQGWGNSCNGLNVVFVLNGNIDGTNGGSGDSWSGSNNGFNSSFGLHISTTWQHNLPAGTTITIGMAGGTWNSGQAFTGWSSWSSIHSWQCFECDPT